MRHFLLVRVSHKSDYFLVSLAGESEWVCNVRAAGGLVKIGRLHRHAATLVEIPPEERAPILYEYYHRWGRRPDSAALAAEARHYFGLDPDASLTDVSQIARHYPVFRICG